MLITAAAGGSVTSGDATLTFAPGSLPADAYVSITLTTVLLPGTTHSVLAYDLLAIDVTTGAKIEQFNSPPVLTVAGATPGSQIFYVPPTGALVPITTSYHGTAVSAGLPHFSTYVVAPPPLFQDVTVRLDNSSIVLVEDGVPVSVSL
ncbi:MAG TPA: hypothetical protein VG371_11220, partial [Solirubrobacteraceae bacterium]|nr:hypothetical protein [Solirubrobacteraceae bacterium]